MNTDHSLLPCKAGRRRLGARVASLVACCSFSIAAAAAEVKVFTAEAFAPVVTAMAPVFEKRSGHRLVVVKDTHAGVARRIRDGQEFDLAVLPPAMLEELGTEGTVSDGSIIPLARVQAGQNATIYAGAVSVSSSRSQPALSLLILLASEDTQKMLKDKGMSAP